MPSFKLISQKILENADGRTDGRTRWIQSPPPPPPPPNSLGWGIMTVVCLLLSQSSSLKYMGNGTTRTKKNKQNRVHILWDVTLPLLWRHDERDGVSNHPRLESLLNPLLRRRSKKTSKFRVTGLCVGNSSVAGEFPAQRASNAENVSIWWRHYDCKYTLNSPMVQSRFGTPWERTNSRHFSFLKSASPGSMKMGWQASGRVAQPSWPHSMSTAPPLPTRHH